MSRTKKSAGHTRSCFTTRLQAEYLEKRLPVSEGVGPLLVLMALPTIAESPRSAAFIKPAAHSLTKTTNQSRSVSTQTSWSGYDSGRKETDWLARLAALNQPPHLNDLGPEVSILPRVIGTHAQLHTEGLWTLSGLDDPLKDVAADAMAKPPLAEESAPTAETDQLAPRSRQSPFPEPGFDSFLQPVRQQNQISPEYRADDVSPRLLLMLVGQDLGANNTSGKGPDQPTTNSWTPTWGELPGGMITPTALGSAVFLNKLFVFAAAPSPNYSIRYNWLEAGQWQTSWSEIPSGITGFTDVAPAAVAFKDKLYVFIRNFSGSILFKSTANGNTWDAAWSTDLVSPVLTAAAPTAAVFNNNLYVFIQKNDTALVYSAKLNDDNDWSPFSEATGYTLSAPNATVFDQKLYLLIREASSNQAWFNYTTNGTNWFYEWRQVLPTDDLITPDALGSTVFANKLVVLKRGGVSNDKIYVNTFSADTLDGSQSQWASLWGEIPDVLTDHAVSATEYDSRLYLFVREKNTGRIRFNSTADAVTSWAEVFGGGGLQTTANGAVFDNKLWAVATGANPSFVVSFNYLNNQNRWSGWGTVGVNNGYSESTPSPVVFNSKLYVFMRNRAADAGNQQIMYTWRGINAWDPIGWTTVPGGFLTSSGVGTAVFGNKLYLFARRLSDNLVHLNSSLDGTSWSGWAVVPGSGGAADSPSSAVFNVGTPSSPSYRLYVFIPGAPSGQINVNYTSDGTNWTGWGIVPPERFTTATVGTTVFANKLWVYARGSNGEVLSNWTTDGVSWRENWTAMEPVNFTTPNGLGAVQFGGRRYLFARKGDNKLHFNVAEDSVVYGQWNRVVHWPFIFASSLQPPPWVQDGVATHAHLLPNGNVLFWGPRTEESAYSIPPILPYHWTRSYANYTPKPIGVMPPHNIFCAGHTFTHDGNLLVTGGDVHPLGTGIKKAVLLTPTPSGTDVSWVPQPDMAHARWYPTNTILGTGNILVTAGAKSLYPTVPADRPEIWQRNPPPPWVALGRMDTGKPDYALFHFFEEYPWMHLNSEGVTNGMVFYSGPNWRSYLLDTTSGSWAGGYPMPGGLERIHGSSVMYAPGKVLVVGGQQVNSLPHASADIFDLATGAGWSATNSMASARHHLNATLQPDGQVLVTGGVAGSTHTGYTTDPVYSAEVWTPPNPDMMLPGFWTTMSSMTRPRWYHSTALLLPDGRILVAGGGNYIDRQSVDLQPNAEIYSPPYLFKGSRPRITNVSTTINYTAGWWVDTTDTVGANWKLNLVRLGSVTHSFNQNQLFVPLTFTVNGSRLDVSPITNANRAPPGHYMLFLVNPLGVPSEAKIIRIDH